MKTKIYIRVEGQQSFASKYISKERGNAPYQIKRSRL
jgi:hypothetical protein